MAKSLLFKDGERWVQRFNSSSITPAAALSKLQAQAGKSEWGKQFVPKLCETGENKGACLLFCKTCRMGLSISNISTSVSRHACKAGSSSGKADGTREAPINLAGKRSAEDEAAASDMEGSPARRAKQRRGEGMYGFTVTSALRALFLLDFCKFVYTSSLPFMKLNNEWLKRGLNRLGLKMPDEKWFRTTGLEMTHEDVQKKVKKKLASVRVRGHAGICMHHVQALPLACMHLHACICMHAPTHAHTSVRTLPPSCSVAMCRTNMG